MGTSPRVSSLTQEVVEAKVLAKGLRDSANKFDSEHWIGTMFNETGLLQHTCYATGVLLGFSRQVKHLRFERRSVPRARSTEQAQDLRIEAQSLDNFVSAVTRAVNTPTEKLRHGWELDCAGQHGIQATPSTAPTVATFYEVTRDGKGLQILGDIKPGFTQALNAALIANPGVHFVALGSGGGSVAEALAAGRVIRARGLTTTLWNNCYSACPLVFVGGADRLIHSPYPSLGFHQLSNDHGAIPMDSPVYAIVAGYLLEMDIDVEFFISAMVTCPL